MKHRRLVPVALAAALLGTTAACGGGPDPGGTTGPTSPAAVKAGQTEAGPTGSAAGAGVATGPRNPDARLTEDPCGFLDTAPLEPLVGGITLWSQSRVFTLANGSKHTACTGETGGGGYLLVQYAWLLKARYATRVMEAGRSLIRPGTDPLLGTVTSLTQPLGGDSYLTVLQYDPNAEERRCIGAARAGATTVKVVLLRSQGQCDEPVTTILREAMKHV